MLNFIKKANVHQLIVWGIIILGTIVSVLPPDLLFFRVVSKFVVQIMFTYLFLGLLFLFFSDQSSMYVSFICCGILCLFLRTRSPFFAPTQQGSNFSIATFNLSLSDDNFDSTISTIINSGADIISIQEVTPDWYAYLDKNPSIKSLYPYDTSLVRMDFYGLAILSKYPFVKIDTFNYKHIPNFMGCIKHDSLNQEIYFITSHTTPPVSSRAYEKIDSHLSKIASKVLEIKKPIIAMGDYQVVPWSSEITRFKTLAKLTDSRRDMPTTYFPHDHIFYSKELECTDFRSIGTNKTVHLGILGTFQIKGQPMFDTE